MSTVNINGEKIRVTRPRKLYWGTDLGAACAAVGWKNSQLIRRRAKATPKLYMAWWKQTRSRATGYCPRVYRFLIVSRYVPGGPEYYTTGTILGFAVREKQQVLHDGTVVTVRA